MLDDKSIIELFFERSEKGLTELDAKYGKLCHKLSRNILNSRQDAEECVNDAYLGLWNAIPPAKPDPLRAYVCKVVRNISLKLYYKKEAEKRSSGYDIAMQELEDCLPAPDTVEAEVEAKELSLVIQKFLDTLNDENSVIFLRRYWFSDTYAEIAKRVGISEKSVSMRLVRIRKQLFSYLSELFTRAYAPYYDGLRYEINEYEETTDESGLTATFLWTMYHLGKGWDVGTDEGVEAQVNWRLQASAAVREDGALELETIAVFADSNAMGPPNYDIPIEKEFPAQLAD